jgi:hypothetical protein
LFSMKKGPDPSDPFFHFPWLLFLFHSCDEAIADTVDRL